MEGRSFNTVRLSSVTGRTAVLYLFARVSMAIDLPVVYLSQRNDIKWP